MAFEDEEINRKILLSDLTVEQFLKLVNTPTKYEFGIKGIAKTFGCCKDKALKIKRSGIIDDALYQNGNIIVIDVKCALELFRENGRKHDTIKNNQ